jgi:xanthine/CO dehydrogenase XdhC/CoxF family maturation factor
VLVTLFSLENKKNPQPGTCLLMEENGNISGRIPYTELRKRILKDVKQAMFQKKSFFKQYLEEAFEVTAFIEYLPPPISLVIVGAGNDAIPMMQMGEVLGWDVRVADGRNTHAKPERFTSACQVLVSKPEKVLEHIPVDDRTVFVLMTHNYNYDLAMLRALLEKEVRYIGMLGPKKKLDRMLDELKEAGIHVTDAQKATIYGPVGLEIGAETAEDIALSVLAEIMGVLNDKKGTSLRNKSEVIHTRTDTMIDQHFLKT